MAPFFIILKLLYSSSNWLLRLSFVALPVALFLSMSAFLFIDKILNSYEKYLVDSYIGTQGRISIESKDKKFIKALLLYSNSKGYKVSLKQEIKTNIFFQNKKTKILKYAKFIILNPVYMKYKFKTNHILKHTIFVNDVFINSFGNYDVNSFKKLYIDKKKAYKIAKIEKIKTGFLSNEPLIFISQEFSKEIFGKIDNDSQMIEYLETNPKHIEDIKKSAQNFASKFKTFHYKIYDLINDTKETRQFFEKVLLLHIGVSLLIVILSIGIILVSISISIEFRKKSLKILQLLGMSIKELSLTISLTVFIVMNVMLLLSIAMQPIYNKIFVNLTGFSKDFFVDIDFFKVGMIFLFSFLFYIIVFYATKYIFISPIRKKVFR